MAFCGVSLEQEISLKTRSKRETDLVRKQEQEDPPITAVTRENRFPQH